MGNCPVASSRGYIKPAFRTAASCRTTYVFPVNEHALKSTKEHVGPACKVWPAEHCSNQFPGLSIGLTDADKKGHAACPA